MIRPLEISDLDSIISIENATQIEPWTKEIFIKCLENKLLSWVILNDTNIAGFIIITLQSGEAHILNLAIKQEAQGQGLGKKLLMFAVEKVRELKGDWIYLEVRRSNLRAIKLYDQLGFVEIGTRKNYYPKKSGREDALVYALQLFGNPS